MEARGYTSRYVGSLVVASCAVGVLFPPSLAMILYSQVISYPVTQLWIAGIFPGLLTGALIAIVSVFMARRMLRKTRPDGPMAPVAATSVATTSPALAVDAAPQMSRTRKIFATVFGLMIPAFVVGGIYSGILTLSEVAASLVGIITLYGLFVTRIGGKRLFGAVRLGGQRAGAVFMIIISARLFSNVLVEQQTIIKIINLVNNAHVSKFWILLLANIAMLAAGTLMDGLSLIIIGAPLFYSLLTPFGITPVHLAIIMAMNLEIGVMHPPLGGNLFAVSTVTGDRVGKIAISVLPYLGVLLFMLMLVTYVPVPGFAWN
jgi:C4-dicarboxylate transporter DctM subunit